MKSTSIIVNQVTLEGRRACRIAFEEIKLPPEEYFIGGDFSGKSEENLLRYFNRGLTQLFITGILDITEDGKKCDLTSLRESFPHLVCVSFSYEALRGPFEVIINKRTENAIDQYREIQNVVRRFLTGGLVRQS